MKISAAILCDYAQVREGLLFIVSGAITRVYRDTLPAGMGIHVAVVLEVPYEEIQPAHELSVTVNQVNTAKQMARAVSGFQLGPVTVEPGESLFVPIVIPLSNVGVDEYGPYDVVVSPDGEAPTIITCYVTPPRQN